MSFYFEWVGLLQTSFVLPLEYNESFHSVFARGYRIVAESHKYLCALIFFSLSQFSFDILVLDELDLSAFVIKLVSEPAVSFRQC